MHKRLHNIAGMKLNEPGLTLRGKTYWYIRMVDGVHHRVSLKTRNLEEAIAKCRKLWTQEVEQAGPVISWSNLIDAWLAMKKANKERPEHLKNLRWILETAVKRFGRKGPHEVTGADVMAWFRSYDNPRTGVAFVEVLARLYRWGVQQKKVPGNPCESLELPRKLPKPVRRRFLTPALAKKLLTVPCEDDLRFALFCMLHAGMRYGEVCAARPEWFDLRAGIIHIASDEAWQPKDGDNRSVPLTGQFKRFLKKYGLRAPFMLRPEKKKAGKSKWRVHLRKPFEAHLEKCGAACSFHDLRRTFASLHVSAGTPIWVVAKWVGDGVQVVERHYAHLYHEGTDIERAWRVK